MTRTLLLGLDGATFTILDPLMEEGLMPFLHSVIQRGTRMDLYSTIPWVTYPAWTTLMTGRHPGAHGIFDFVRAEETKQGVYVRPMDARDVRTEMIWSIASRNNRTVTALNFPLMFPARDLNGYAVPGFVSWRLLSRAVYPAELYDALRTLPGFSSREVAWDMDLETKAVQSMPEEEYEPWLLSQVRRGERWFEILSYIMKNHPTNLTAYLNDGPDKIQHLAWRFLHKDFESSISSAREKRIRDICRDYFQQLDGFLAAIVRQAGEATRIFIVSDHGFGPTQQIFYLNVWLHQHGYLQWGEDRVLPSQTEDLFAPRRSSFLYKWENTSAYALTPSSMGLKIRVANRQGEVGPTPAEYTAFRDKLASELLAYRDPRTGEQVVQRVWTRDEAFAGEQMHLAPDLTLALHDQGFISTLNADAVQKPRSEVKGTHVQKGIFIAAGPGIRQGHIAMPYSIVDVCPALLYSLDLAIPSDLDGTLPLDLYEPAWLAAHPPTQGPPTQPISLPQRAMMSAEEQEVLHRHYQGLGYLE